MEKNNQLSNFCFIASLVSVACSIGVWCLSGDDPAHSERFGIFVGLWAPTLMALSVYYQERQGVSMNTVEFLFMLVTVLSVTSVITAFRFIVHKLGSDEYVKKPKIDLTTTIKNVII